MQIEPANPMNLRALGYDMLTDPVRRAAMEQALGNPAAKYDATKFTWIGRVASSNNMQLAWHTSKAQSVEDALKVARRHIVHANVATDIRTHIRVIRQL